MLSSRSNATGSHPDFTPQGWTASPSGRGTVDIVWSCTSTMFLCGWTVLCTNIPSDTCRGWWQITLHKAMLASLVVMCPDFLTLIAVGQRESALRNLKEMRNLIGANSDHWTLTHSFFVDMGGFLAVTQDGISWPLNGQELEYLIANGWISPRDFWKDRCISKRAIDDKNKSDTVVRVITVGQTLWFVLNCIGRAVNKIGITTMELTTLGFVITALPVAYIWLQKPADINERVRIHVNATVNDLREQAHVQAGWSCTPLDNCFDNQEISNFSKGTEYHLSILRHLGLLPHRRVKPITFRPDYHILPVSMKGHLICAFVGFCAHAAILVAWNFWFNSEIERVLWRTSTVVTLFGLVVALTLELGIQAWWPWIMDHERVGRGQLQKETCHPSQNRASQAEMAELSALEGEELNEKGHTSNAIHRAWGRLHRFLGRLRNISPEQDPWVTMCLRIVIPMLFFSSLYALGRIYLFVEILLALRGMPPKIYLAVNWSSCLPHV